MAITLTHDASPLRPPYTTPLFASWHSLLDLRPQTDGRAPTQVHVYRLITTPSRPVAVTHRVTILTPHPTSNPPGLYQLHDAHICGDIVFISQPHGGWVSAALENECARGMTKRVAVLIPYTPSCIELQGDAVASPLPSPWDMNEHQMWFKPPDPSTRCAGTVCEFRGLWSETVDRQSDGDSGDDDTHSDNQVADEEPTIEISDAMVDTPNGTVQY